MHHTTYEKHHTIFRTSKFLILVQARALIRFVLSMYLCFRGWRPRLPTAAQRRATVARGFARPFGGFFSGLRRPKLLPVSTDSAVARP